jgi:hypothetical protein
MFERGFQAREHFGGGFEECLEARFCHAIDILAGVLDQLLQLLLDVFLMHGWIGGVFGIHGFKLAATQARATGESWCPPIRIISGGGECIEYIAMSQALANDLRGGRRSALLPMPPWSRASGA